MKENVQAKSTFIYVTGQIMYVIEHGQTKYKSKYIGILCYNNYFITIKDELTYTIKI